jgi:hypothetical protein
MKLEKKAIDKIKSLNDEFFFNQETFKIIREILTLKYKN